MADLRGANAIVSFLRELRTVRRFRPGAIPRRVVEDILEVARWSGSAMNLQPWEFVMVWDRGTLEDLSRLEGYAGHLAGGAVGIVLVMAWERIEQETFDEGRVSERISLAAAAHGVGSSVGWFTKGGRDTAKKTLSVPPERLVRTAISLGYPEETPPPGRPTLQQGRNHSPAWSTRIGTTKARPTAEVRSRPL